MLIPFSVIPDKYQIVPKGVIHVGMHKAEEYPAYKQCGVESVLFVEANPALAASVRIDNPKCYIVNAAVSDKREKVTFNVTNNGESSSILELADHLMFYPGIVNVGSFEVETSTLDDILSNYTVSDYNIINLDIQGAELKALQGLSFWEGIDAVYTEVNYREMYKGCALISDLNVYLGRKGFVKVEEVDTGSGWGDALYVRNPK